MPQSKIRTLFVCMGNICRSPTAEGVFRELVRDAGLQDRIETDSCGTIRYHQGKAPDSRAQEAALARGIDISDLRARQLDPYDYGEFDYLLAMDRDNMSYLVEHSPERYRERLHLFLDFAPDASAREVPDPYYGGTDGFDLVLDLVKLGARGLLAHIRERDL